MDFITKHLAFLTKFFLNNDPEDMTVLDTTVWADTGVSEPGFFQDATLISQVEIVIDAILPNGNIFHDGDDTFANPDIDRGVTDSISGIVITKDVNGNILNGDYRIDYKVKVTDSLVGVGTVRQFIDIGGGRGRVELPGDWTFQLINQTQLEIVASGTNNGVYVLDNFSYDAVTDITRVDFTTVLSEDFVEGDTQGSLEITYTAIYTISKILNYEYIPTAGCIILTVDCDKSELRSDDQTDYSQYDNNTPASRNHVLRYPIDLDPPIADVTSENAIISVNPIYTNVWTSTIAPVVEITQTDGLIIQDTLNASESIDVQCDDQWCTIFNCLENIDKNYRASIVNGNQSEIDRWEQSWTKIQGYHMLWRIARSCGDSEAAAKYTALAVKEANAQDCCTPVDPKAKSEPSKLVQAITDGGLTTIYNELVNQWFSGDGVPSDLIHDNGDFYINTIDKPDPGNGDIYLKIAGVWVLQTNISGDDGLNGINGTDGVDGNDGTDGSQIFEVDGLPADNIGVTGDYNIRVDATIDRKTDDDTLFWEPYADPNGDDGTQIFAETGIPGNGIGVDGDYSIDSASALIYRKAAGVWALYADPNGADGTGALFVDAVRQLDSPPTLITWETWAGKTHDIPGGSIAVGDTVRVTVDFNRSSSVGSGDRFRIVFDNQNIEFILPDGHSTGQMIMDFTLVTPSSSLVWAVVGVVYSSFQTGNGDNPTSSINFGQNGVVSPWSGSLQVSTDIGLASISISSQRYSAGNSDKSTVIFRVDLIKNT